MKKILLSLLAAAGIGSTGCSAQSDGITVLPPQDFIAKAKSDTTSIILDVRTPEEFADGHLEGAKLLDFLNTEAFDKGLKLLDPSPPTTSIAGAASEATRPATRCSAMVSRSSTCRAATSTG